MDKDVSLTFPGDESIPLLGVKPLDLAFQLHTPMSLTELSSGIRRPILGLPGQRRDPACAGPANGMPGPWRGNSVAAVYHSVQTFVNSVRSVAARAFRRLVGANQFSL